MKSKLGLLLILLITGLLLSSCAQGEKKLYLFNWTYYTPDSLIQKFKEEYKVDVVYDTFDSNESMFAKLKAGGSNYDIVFPSADYVSIMIHQNMLAKIDHDKLNNYKNIDPALMTIAKDYDPGLQYSIPYYWGAAGVAVNKTKVPSYEASWSIFSRKDLQGKMTMLDDMREVIGDALKYLGKSVNTTNEDDLKAAGDLINTKWKPNLLKFDAEAFAKGFSAGEFSVSQGYAENIYLEIGDNKTMQKATAFFIPKEGGPAYVDSMVILKNSKNKDLALKFINFIHDPAHYVEFLDYFGFPSTVNVPARDLKKGVAHYTAADVARCELKLDLGDKLDLYNNLWQAIKVGK